MPCHTRGQQPVVSGHSLMQRRAFDTKMTIISRVADIALDGVRFRQDTTAHTAIRAGGGSIPGSGLAVFHDQSSALPIKKPAIRGLFPEPGRASLPKLSVLWKAITGPEIAKPALTSPALWQRPGYGLVQQAISSGRPGYTSALRFHIGAKSLRLHQKQTGLHRRFPCSTLNRTSSL